MSRKQRSGLGVAIVAVSFLMALLAGAIMLVFQGQNPAEVYYYLLVEPLSSPGNLVKVLGKATPLIFAGLASALAFRCNVFNIGVEGQLYLGGLTAAYLGCALTGLPHWLHILLCIVGAMIAGALCAWIPAILKVKLGVHEVISTIMLNYVVSSVVSLIVVKYFRNPGPTARTPYVAESARLFQFKPPEHLNTGLILAVLLCLAAWAAFNRTSFGWQVDAAGRNLEAARYSGIPAGRLVIITMMLSGAVAGLVGMERVLGAYGYMEVNFSPGYGFDGITIAMIAGNHPIGVLITALLLGLMSYGGVNINIMTSVPTEWVNVLTGLVFAFVVIGNTVLGRWKISLPALGRRKKEGTA